jgi:hypothetical protein
MNNFVINFISDLIREGDVRNSFQNAKKEVIKEIQTYSKVIKRYFGVEVLPSECNHF